MVSLRIHNLTFGFDAGGRDLVLPQFCIPDFVDSPRKALPTMRAGGGGWEGGSGMGEGGTRVGM